MSQLSIDCYPLSRILRMQQLPCKTADGLNPTPTRSTQIRTIMRAAMSPVLHSLMIILNITMDNPFMIFLLEGEIARMQT